MQTWRKLFTPCLPCGGQRLCKESRYRQHAEAMQSVVVMSENILSTPHQYRQLMPLFASVMTMTKRITDIHWYHAAGFIAVLVGLFIASAIAMTNGQKSQEKLLK